MSDITLKQLIKDTNEVAERFPKKFGKRDNFIDLVEEVGELAQAIMISEGWKTTNDPSKQRTIEDVKDALGDVMFQIIRIAEQYEVDLAEEYPKVLAHLRGRLDSGEFEMEETK